MYSDVFELRIFIDVCVWCRMPVQYVIEEWDFRDLTLKMRPPVFIPRPETEVGQEKNRPRIQYIQYSGQSHITRAEFSLCVGAGVG